MLRPLLGGALCAALLLSVTPASAQCTSTDVQVSAFDHSSAVGYLATGVQVMAGDLLTITADPNDAWSAGTGCRTSGPDGLVAGNPYGCVFPLYTAQGLTAPYGALVGRISGGAWFLVGSSYSAPASASGELELAYWDSNFADNSGDVEATVETGAPSLEVCDGVDNDCDGEVDEDDFSSFVVSQAGVLGSIPVVSTPGSVADLYSYGNPVAASYNGALPAAVSDTSQVFIHEDTTTGELSLVIVHDVPNDGDGGDVVFTVSGLGAGAYVAQADGEGGDVFTLDGSGGASLDWSWVACCTDGIALGGIDWSGGGVTIDPAFGSGIASWLAVGGDGSALALDPSLPVTIGPGACNACPTANANGPYVAECTASAANVTLDGTGSSDPDGDALSYDWSVDGAPIASGAMPTVSLSLGSHTVDLAVSDGQCGATASTTATVQDTLAPALTCPDDETLELSADTCEASGSWTAEAVDQCEGASSDTQSASFDAPGSQTLTYSASDASGNAASCAQTVTAVDVTDPVYTAGPVQELWPPNHKYRTVTLSSCGSATDACDGALDLDAAGAITLVTSDEPEDVGGKGDGKTTDDMVIVDGHTVMLRAERQGGLNGRVYTVHFTLTDGSGNVTDATCRVDVPHDKGPKGGAVDDGAVYTVP